MESLILRPMTLDDVKQMSNWKRHEDPWFYHYNFEYDTEEERLAWYKSKRVFLARNIFGLFLSEKLIGFITIKNYNWIMRTAEMGISLDLNYVNKGYGSEGLKLYLDYVFSHTLFNRIVLRTVLFNKRAIRSYEKVGFKFLKKSYMPYEEQRYALEILKENPNADYIDGELYAYYYIMAIDKKNVRKNNEF